MAQVSGQSCGQATRTTSLMASFYVEQLYPVAHRRARLALQVREAADICGGNDIRSARLQRRELAASHLAPHRRLGERITAGGAGARGFVIHSLPLVARPGMQP